MGLTKLVIVPSFCKVMLQCVFMKNGSLGEFFQPFGGRLVCYGFEVVERVAYGEDYRLGFCGEDVLGTVTGEIETDGCIK